MTCTDILLEYELWLTDRTINYDYLLKASTALIRKAPDKFKVYPYVLHEMRDANVSINRTKIRRKFLKFLVDRDYHHLEVTNDLEKTYRSIESILVDEYCEMFANNYKNWLKMLITDIQLKEIGDPKTWFFRHGYTGNQNAITLTLLGFLKWVEQNYQTHAELIINGILLDLRPIIEGFEKLIDEKIKIESPHTSTSLNKVELVSQYSSDPKSIFVLSCILIQGLTASEILKLKVADLKSGHLNGLIINSIVMAAWEQVQKTSPGRDRDLVLEGLSMKDVTIIANRFLKHYNFKCEGVNGLRNIRMV